MMMRMMSNARRETGIDSLTAPNLTVNPTLHYIISPLLILILPVPVVISYIASRCQQKKEL
jgi:hypothetical protein